MGGTGIAGAISRSLDKKLTAKEAENQKRHKLRQRRLQIDDEIQHAYGRMFYHLYRAIETGAHNGELQKSFAAIQAAEQKKKDLDREILAEVDALT